MPCQCPRQERRAISTRLRWSLSDTVMYGAVSSSLLSRMLTSVVAVGVSTHISTHEPFPAE